MFRSLYHLVCQATFAAVEPRVPSHKLHKDEFPVPQDTDTPDISQPVLERSEEDQGSHDQEEEEEEEKLEEEEEEDDIPDAGAIEEEPSEGSDVSQAAPSDQASSSSSGDDAMVSLLLNGTAMPWTGLLGDSWLRLYKIIQITQPYQTACHDDDDNNDGA